MTTILTSTPGFDPRSDIFRAAREDDVIMLRAALAAGESLGQQEEIDGRTPLHVAVLHGAQNFLREAVSYAADSVWERNFHGMRPLDLCWLKNDTAAHDILHNAMYPPGWFLELDYDGL